VKAGERLHLNIEAEGSPKPTFQWFRENIPVCSEQEYIIPAFRFVLVSLATSDNVTMSLHFIS